MYCSARLNNYFSNFSSIILTNSRTTMDRKNNKFIETIYECGLNGIENGIFFVLPDDKPLDGRIITIDNQELVNFGSCSYLGFETDNRVKQAAIDAINKFGVHYSSSRAYSACSLYEETEHLLSKIFDNNHAVLGGTTTLTHIGAIPILIHEDDLVILDQKVHGSIQVSVQLAKAKGTRIEMIKHSKLDALEDLIKENPNKYNRIWYMIDGVYSMYGDFAPIKELYTLLDKYSNFYLYIDDAHGMSWTGRNGAGYIMSQVDLHEKVFLVTSLGKGFGVGCGIFVVKNQEIKRKLLTCSSSYTFSGPVNPPILAAIRESAKIHLTDEITERQEKLRRKIELTKNLIDDFDLPHVCPSESPIFFIGLGLPRVGYNMVKRLIKEGFFTNIGIFPTVPVNCTGLRLPITISHTDDDIMDVLSAVKHHFPKVLEEENIDINSICRSFKDPFEKTVRRFGQKQAAKNETQLKVQVETDINEISPELWNELLGDRGIFDWEGCKFIQETFSNNTLPEDNWNLYFLIIRDAENMPILATFFSDLLCKDDMTAPAEVSKQIEEKRKNDKYYLCSRVLMMGSLITEGDHLYINRNHKLWKQAVLQMIRTTEEIKHKIGASIIQLRDLDSADAELREVLIKEGFFRIEMPESHVIENVKSVENYDEFLYSLSVKSRYHIRKHMIDNEHLFEVKNEINVKNVNIEEYYKLYKNIKNKSFRLNTFDLPLLMFENAFNHKSWEILQVFHKETNKLSCFVLSYKSVTNNYCPLVIGLDYAHNEKYSCYRQALFQLYKRASVLNAKNIYLGMDAGVEKRKLEAKVYEKSLYLRSDDNFSLEVMSVLKQKN